MIISLRAISYYELIDQLTPEDKIMLFSCNSCIKGCGIGGMEKMKQLEEMLTCDGFTVLGKDLCSYGCTLNLVEKHRTGKLAPLYEEATVVIPIVCEVGLSCENYVFGDKKVIPIAKTLGTGNGTRDFGPVLTTPYESTGLAKNPKGYTLAEAAEKTGLYAEFFSRSEQMTDVQPERINLTVDGKIIQASPKDNLLSACLKNGIQIPHLCYHDDISSYGACRLCLVKIKGKRGMVASCSVPVENGMEIITTDDEIEACRRVVLELLLASGEHDCLTCTKGVPTPLLHCELQTLVRQADITEQRFEKVIEKQACDDTSEFIFHDPSKCILCGRCVRACEELAGQGILGFLNRGDKTMVIAGLKNRLGEAPCAGCKACTNVCPTGALTDKVVYCFGENWAPVRKNLIV